MPTSRRCSTRLLASLAVVIVMPGTALAQYGGDRPTAKATERIIASEVVNGKRSGRPVLAAVAERDDEGRAFVLVSCTQAVEQTRRERVETVTEGDYWPMYAGIAVVGLIGGTASAVATAALSGGAGDPGERQLTTALGITGALAGATIAVGGGVVALMRMPQTTTSERTVPNGLMDAPCLPGVAIEIQARQWSDEGETDDDGFVRFMLPSVVDSASVTFASAEVGRQLVTVDAPPSAQRRGKSEPELHAEAEADVAAEARHEIEPRKGELTPVPALDAASAPPLVCPEGARLVGGRPPVSTTEACNRPDGKKEGGFREWAAGGKLKIEGMFHDNLADGPWRGWYANGAPQFIGAYTAGKWSGRWSLWGPDGRRKPDVNYRDGSNVAGDEVLAGDDARCGVATAPKGAPAVDASRDGGDDDVRVAVTIDGLVLRVRVGQQDAGGRCSPSAGARVQLTTGSGVSTAGVLTGEDGFANLAIPPEALNADGQAWRLAVRTAGMADASLRLEPNDAALAASLERATSINAFHAFERRFPGYALSPVAAAKREALVRDAEIAAKHEDADLEKRRAEATVAWKRAKARTPAALDDIIETYGEDALSPELVAQQEAFDARIGERDTTMTYDDGRVLWLSLSTHPATVEDMMQKGYGANAKEVAAGLAAMACAYVTDLPSRPTYKVVVEINDTQAVVLTGTRARFAQLCKASGAAIDKVARSMASVVTLVALPLRVELADPDLSSKPLREVQELAACVTSRRPTALGDTQWLMIEVVRTVSDLHPRWGRSRFARTTTQTIAVQGDEVAIGLVTVSVAKDGELFVGDSRPVARAFGTCANTPCTRIDLKSFGRDAGVFSLATAPLRSWPTRGGPDVQLKNSICTTVLTADDARYIPVDAFRAVLATMIDE